MQRGTSVTTERRVRGVGGGGGGVRCWGRLKIIILLYSASPAKSCL